MLELQDSEFKTTMSDMLRTTMVNVDNMQNQMDNIGREMEVLRQTKK